MNRDYRLKRHTMLWESQNKQIKRVLIGGLLFGYLLLVNILTPYSHRLNEIKGQMKELSAQAKQIEKSSQDLARLGETLDGIAETIILQPWMAEKDKLIRKLADLNAGGRPTWKEYQNEADSTVSVIGSLVLQMVGDPLGEFVTNSSYGELMPKLAGELRALPRVVEGWTRKNHGNVWYRTVDAKEAAVQSLTSDLDNQLQRISVAIEQEQPNLAKKAVELKTQIAKLNEMKMAEEKKLSEKLDAEMKKILPNWISGIISVQQMMLYPFVIIGIACYVSFVAFALTNHYHFMASGLDIEDVGGSDSALSSLWTLTFRGRMGTLLTLATYVLFIMSMWFFYEQGFKIFREWFSTESGRILSDNVIQVVLWMGRVILLALLMIVVLRPFYAKMQPAPALDRG